MNQRKKNRTIITLGFKVLLEECSYTKTEVIGKLEALNKPISKASFSNLFTGNRSVGFKKQQLVADGFCEILYKEKGLVFHEVTQTFQQTDDPNWRPGIIFPPAEELPVKNTITFFHQGRRSVDEKVTLYRNAQHEIIELGVRLKNFSSHFTEQNENRFRNPVLDLLKKGVHFHCYILNPTGRFAEPYFRNRDLVQKGEWQAFEEIPMVQEKLIQVFSELNNESTKGKMHLHHVNTFPYLHASVVDGNFANGKMFIAQYLYGISRANAPGIAIRKNKEEKLFLKYWRSIKAMISHSKEILIT